MKKWRLLSTVLVIALLLVGGTSAFAAQDKGYEIENVAVQTYSRLLGGTAVQVYYELHNTSETALYCSSGKVELEDANGHLVGTSDSISVYPQIVGPGEIAYYTEVVYLDDSIDFELSPYVKAKASEAKCQALALEVSDVSFSADTFGYLSAMGRVKNNTGEDLDGMIYVSMLMYDEEARFLGCMFTILTEDLEDGDRTAFELSGLMLPEKIAPEDIADYKVFAYPWQIQF